jgi:prepilin-type N-terminal cleavage/methylation domain-containing protein
MPGVMSRLRHQHGFTLIELLVSMSIGTIVLLAVFTLVDQAIPATNRVTDRVETQQRGRNAMEQMVQRLRSSVCVQATTQANGAPVYQSPIEAASDDNTVTFFTQVMSSSTTPFQPDRRQLSYDAPNKRIVERRYAYSATNPVTWPVLSATRTVLGNVVPVVGKPIFTYRAYDGSSINPPIPAVATPLSAVDAPRVIAVEIQFQVLPFSVTGKAAQGTTFDDTATLRIPPDATSATTLQKGPVCRF